MREHPVILIGQSLLEFSQSIEIPTKPSEESRRSLNVDGPQQDGPFQDSPWSNCPWLIKRFRDEELRRDPSAIAGCSFSIIQRSASRQSIWPSTYLLQNDCSVIPSNCVSSGSSLVFEEVMQNGTLTERSNKLSYWTWSLSFVCFANGNSELHLATASKPFISDSDLMWQCL